MPVGFTVLHAQAAWLFVLLPAVWLGWRRRPDTAWRALRSAIFACLILALMQPSLIRRSADADHVYVVDQGARLSPQSRARARTIVARLLERRPPGRAILVQMGGVPIAAPVDRRILLTDAGERGSWSAALSRALDALPSDGGGAITLIGDGRSTDRHWGRAVAALVARGIPVDTVEIPARSGAPFISDVRVPPVRIGEAAQVTVTVEGRGANLSLALQTGERVLATSAPFPVDGTVDVTMPFVPDRTGFVPLRAVLRGGATRGAAFDTVAAVQSPLRVLYLGERQAGAAPRLQTLLGRGFAVEQRPVAAAGAVDAAGQVAAGQDVVIVDDVPAARLPVPVQRRLLARVNEGLGLLYSGGEAAFGTGGYRGTPIAAALPVTLRQDEQVQQPSIALAIVIDSSGSMVGNRIDLAQQVARLAVRRLTPADSVGVVEFYGSKQWAVPMQPARHVADVERAIGRMQAQGATMLFPALQEAYYGLRNTAARYKHILVISDAGVEEEQYGRLLRSVADSGVTVSTVLIGGDSSGEALMSEWARIGRGRFYSVADEFSVVDIDFKQPQVKPQSGYRPGRIMVDARPGWSWWRDMAVGAMPPLDGHARAARREQADTLVSTTTGDPILASWPYGAGRVTALMTEPLGQGTRNWQGWRDYGEWLGRIVARTADQQPALAVTLARRFDRLSMTVQRVGTASQDPPVVRLVDAAGRTTGTSVPLEPRAPGLFVADVPFPADRAALVEARVEQAVVYAADRAGSDVRPEAAIPAAFTLPLAELARMTGGTSGTDATPRAAAARVTGYRATDLWTWLALLALALYLADITCRRWPARRRSAAQ